MAQQEKIDGNRGFSDGSVANSIKRANLHYFSDLSAGLVEEMNREMEIICVGNELLIGKTLNTNAQWLARRATCSGISVKRILVVSDETNEIAEAILDALKRKPPFIITTGGLGPTFDDKTLEGIAKALNRKLKVNGEALEMVKKKYEDYSRAGHIAKIELTPHRKKMATLPEKSKPLPNPIGTAPGMLTQAKRTFIIALPGVPAEMEAIFEESVLSMLKKEAGELMFYETSMYVGGIMESTLAPLIDETMHVNPYVYIKSHPKGAEKEPHIEIHLSTTAKDSNVAKSRVEKTVVQLSELVQKSGGKIKFKRSPKVS